MNQKKIDICTISLHMAHKFDTLNLNSDNWYCHCAHRTMTPASKSPIVFLTMVV